MNEELKSQLMTAKTVTKPLMDAVAVILGLPKRDDTDALSVLGFIDPNHRWVVERLASPASVPHPTETKKRLKHTYEAYISNVLQYDIGTTKYRSVTATAFDPSLAICLAALEMKEKTT